MTIYAKLFAMLISPSLMIAALAEQETKPTQQETSPEIQLAKARQEFQDDMSKASISLRKGFEKVERIARKTGDAEALLTIKRQKKAFENSGDLPTSISTKDYLRQAKKAKDKLRTTLLQIRRDYTRKGDERKVREISNELERLEAISTPRRFSNGRMSLLDTAESGSPVWRYTERKPASGWMDPEFNDMNWSEAIGAFGTPGNHLVNVNTHWASNQIWLRTIMVAPVLENDDRVFMRISYDDNPEIYINGKLCATLRNWNTGYHDILLDRDQSSLIKPGRNTIAIMCRNTGGRQTIDVGFSIVRSEP